MDFTMSVIDSSRGIPSTQPTHPISVVTPLVATTDQPLLPQPQPLQPPSPSQPEQEQQEDENEQEEEEQQQQQQPQQPQSQQQQQPHELEQQDQLQPQPRNSSLHESSAETEMEVEEEEEEEELQDLTKDDPEEALTPPPPRVSSVTLHHGNRVEKSTDTDDFEPLIKVEIRDIDDFEPVIKVEIQGELLGLNTGDKEKDQIVQLHFNNVSEVLHYFSQWSVPQHIDAFNFLTSPDLVRSINPDLMRNHFLYVLNPQEGVRLASNGCSSLGPTTTPTPPSQVREPTPPLTEKQDSGSSSSYTSKQEDPQHQSGESITGAMPSSSILTRPGIDPPTAPPSFACWICGLDMQKSLQFEEHMVDIHSVDKPYRCEDCGVTFKRKAHLDRHRRIHLPTRPYQCAVCGKGFTRNENVRRHSFTHSGEKPYHCPTCSKTFSRLEHLTKHLLIHARPSGGPHSPPPGSHPHTPGEYEYLCSPADSPTPPQPQLGAASAAAVSAITSLGGAGQIPTSLLHAAVPQLLPPSTTHSSIKHPQPHHRLAAHHSQGLASTLLLQTPDQNGRLVSLSPGTGTTSSTSAVTTSPTSHHGGQSSSSSSSSSHLGSSGTSGVIHHQRGYNQKGEPVPRPYQCGVCGRAFIRNEHLRRHLLIHSGEKPHACGTCSKAFSRREHLTKHMRSHIKVTIPGSVPPTSQSGPVQVSGVSVSLPSPQPSLTLPQSVATSLPTSSVVVTPASAAHQQSPHSVSHTVAAAAAASHGTPVAHAAHLPPGTHYLPMFGLLAEVV